MAFEVHVTERAERDVLEVLEWMRAAAPDAAERWIEGLIAKLSSLESGPFRCSRAPESDDVKREIRQLFYGTNRRNWFRVLFDVEHETVRVLRVRRCAQRQVPRDELT
jgi:plasmid stabilization system protein ParE